MERFLQILSLWGVVTQVVQSIHDNGAQSVLKASLNSVNNLVQSGHLSTNILQDVGEILPAIVEAHPAVLSFPTDPGKATVTAPAPATPIDYNLLAAAIRQQAAAGDPNAQKTLAAALQTPPAAGGN